MESSAEEGAIESVDFGSGILKDVAVHVSTNAESDNGFAGPENVTNRLSCIVNRYGKGSFAPRMADSDNEISMYLNLMPISTEGSSPMENEVVANDSNVARNFGRAELVNSAIREVDWLDEYLRERFMQKYWPAKHPPIKKRYIHSMNLSGDWKDNSSKAGDSMSLKLTSEATQIGSANYEVGKNNSFISEAVQIGSNSPGDKIDNNNLISVAVQIGYSASHEVETINNSSSEAVQIGSTSQGDNMDNNNMIFEAMKIGSSSHGDKTDNNLISEDFLPNTYVRKSSQKKRKYD